MVVSRRQWSLGAVSASVAHGAAPRPDGVLIETHLHLFGDDPVRFPYSGVSYKPIPNPGEQYVQVAHELKLDYEVTVHPTSLSRMADLLKKNPGRIASLRIHELHPAGTPPTTSGAIRDRDLRNPQVMKCIRTAHDLGLSLQRGSRVSFGIFPSCCISWRGPAKGYAG